MPAAYRLDELGWLQFQQLCTLLLEPAIAPSDWSGSADELREASHKGGLAVCGERFDGPVRVKARWYRGEAHLIIQRGDGDEVVLGPWELSAAVDADPPLRRRMPAVLGIRDLDELIEPAAAEASTLDRSAAEQLAPVFVATGPYRRTLEVLERHAFVVLTGPPEMGKTAIARMVGLAQLSAGWEAHECAHPDDFFRAYAADRAQVFIADDAFGSTEYRPDVAERWARELAGVLSRTDERHWLIWTSRPAPLRAGLRRVHRERGLERFPSPGDVQVDASALDQAEKALILFRHAKAAGLTPAQIDYVRENGLPVVRNRYFTPERIRRYVSRVPVLLGLGVHIERELRLPTEAMAESLHALEPEQRDLLIAMLDAPPVTVTKRELTAAVRRHHDGGLAHPPAELVEGLADHFLRVSDGSVSWVHPSWRDLVIDELASGPALRAHFLSHCELEGVLLAISSEGGAEGTRAFPLMAQDSDWDALCDRVWRLVSELEEHDLSRLLWSLAAAVGSADGSAQSKEVDSLGGNALTALGRRYHGQAAPIQVVEPWFELAYSVEGGDTPPAEALWIELLPTPPLTREDLDAVQDWVRLAELLMRYAPQRLQRLGFPDGCAEAIDAVLDLGRRLRDQLGEDTDAVVRVAKHLRVLLDGVDRPNWATEVLEAVADIDYVVWAEPDPDLSVAPADPDLTVARILRDL
ncbi:MAG: nSTAND3 domain-containing NTPase [Thermoleophilaceae bacterium]